MRARKRFGQHFLTDQNTIERILHAINPLATDAVVEIGPGRGALTRGLATSGCELLVIEIDRELAADLEARYDRAVVVSADALRFDYATLGSKSRVVGNLPYNISTPLLFKLFAYATSFHDMTFMLQEEVVDRICAAPGTSDYGRLSVMSQYYCLAEKLFTVPATAFTPQPRVTSAIIRLIPHQHLRAVRDISCLQSVLVSAFSARRKTVRNALKRLIPEEELRGLGIDTTLRPGQLSLDDFVRCADRLWEISAR